MRYLLRAVEQRKPKERRKTNIGTTYVFSRLAVEALPLEVALTIREVRFAVAQAVIVGSEGVMAYEADEASVVFAPINLALDDVGREVEFLDRDTVPAYKAGDQILVAGLGIWWRLIVIGEQAEVVLSRTDEVLERPLEWLFAGSARPMVLRLRNALQALGVRTVGDVLNKTEADILRTPNTGRKSLNLLKEVLKEKVGPGVGLGKVRIV